MLTAKELYEKAERELPPDTREALNDLTARLKEATGPDMGLVDSKDRQIGGDHYLNLQIQVWDIIREYDLNHWEACALKYILRHKQKGQVLDIKKAIHYLEYIEENYNTLYNKKKR